MIDQQPRPDIQNGEMPTPRYFQVEGVKGRVEKLVGIEGHSVDGDVKTFIWWQNLRLPDSLQEPIARAKVADVLAKLKLEHDADGAVGPAVDLSESNVGSGRIKIFPDVDAVGVYVEKGKRFTLRRVRAANPFSAEWQNYLSKAQEAIPRPAPKKPPAI